MVQAARSGVQNIAEGSQASGTSKKTELKLTKVARASLEELRLDYEDYLRQNGLCLWPQEDPRRKELVSRRPANADEVAAWVTEIFQNGQYGQYGHNGQNGQKEMRRSLCYAEFTCNAALVLIGVASQLLDRQLAAQAKSFEKEGGFSERVYRVRERNRRMS